MRPKQIITITEGGHSGWKLSQFCNETNKLGESVTVDVLEEHPNNLDHTILCCILTSLEKVGRLDWTGLERREN